MLKKTITFKGFDDEERTLDLYFNLTKTELVDWSADSEEGIQAEMQEAIRTKDQRKLLDFVKELVFRSYGIRDKDGIHFDKSPEISRRFENSAMYDPLLLELFADEGNATSAFINGLMPADLVAAAMKDANIPNAEEQERLRAGVQPSARERFAQTQEDVPAPAAPIPASSVPVQEAPRVEVVPTQPAQAEETHRPFRVVETPMDDEAAQWAEFKRRQAAGEL
ncbi:hypothetical protein SEA_DAMASCUS_42 [Microbacterium phage Damascus]|nr:hypothetical protein SEA_DAMASCUS_42 [Microbacterium phage Damascus]